MDMDYTVGEVELTYKSTSKSRNKIYSSEDAYEVLLSTYREGTICYKEYFKVLFLNQAKQVLGYTLISEGYRYTVSVSHPEAPPRRAGQSIFPSCR